MRIDITGKPMFWFNLTKPQIDLIMQASASHYDLICKNSSRVGGFIYGWKNQLEFDQNTLVCGDFRDVDTVLKILEIARYLGDDACNEAMKLSNSLRTALSKSNELCKQWTLLLDV